MYCILMMDSNRFAVESVDVVQTRLSTAVCALLANWRSWCSRPQNFADIALRVANTTSGIFMPFFLHHGASARLHLSSARSIPSSWRENLDRQCRLPTGNTSWDAVESRSVAEAQPSIGWYSSSWLHCIAWWLAYTGYFQHFKLFDFHFIICRW